MFIYIIKSFSFYYIYGNILVDINCNEITHLINYLWRSSRTLIHTFVCCVWWNCHLNISQNLTWNMTVWLSVLSDELSHQSHKSWWDHSWWWWWCGDAGSGGLLIRLWSFQLCSGVREDIFSADGLTCVVFSGERVSSGVPWSRPAGVHDFQPWKVRH